MKSFNALVVAAVAMLFVAAPAHAIVPVFDMGLLTNTVSQDHNVKAEEERAGSMAQQRLLTPDFSASQPAAPAAALNYERSRERTRRNLAAFVEKTRRVDPAGAAGMEQSFASQDIMNIIAQGLVPLGLRTDNVAHAYAAWWMSAWMAANDPAASSSPEQAQAVARQAADALRATSGFAEMTNAQKQEMAEVYLVQAAMIDAAVDQAAGDAARLRDVAASVRQGAMASGMDLGRMRLTRSGFVPR